jgi:hypothetical protein
MLIAGQRMVRVDDGMKGQVELVAMPGFEQYEELRIVYMDRGEKRIAGKRESWQPVTPVPRKLRFEEVMHVAFAADRALRSLERNEPSLFWQPPASDHVPHDPELVKVIADYLDRRG